MTGVTVAAHHQGSPTTYEGQRMHELLVRHDTRTFTRYRGLHYTRVQDVKWGAPRLRCTFIRRGHKCERWCCGLRGVCPRVAYTRVKPFSFLLMFNLPEGLYPYIAIHPLKYVVGNRNIVHDVVNGYHIQSEQHSSHPCTCRATGGIQQPSFEFR
jgi:hypothetical protein